ncbi:hypothetical protein BGP77_02530 [Saccharospirillum sp. MSK14-1]|uniref:FecR family protein n=1 Tax=Saccharospirillum sp. MSK14-1 TaxID=1897632 RepID=UPI000D3ACC84|nr:FecR domain-containing protein [Saccharospirillum sp. MSK14-1]PTY36207.1 hypothetical protein BGP77_02530 [Saccharospirillum sp. MSK14-1]
MTNNTPSDAALDAAIEWLALHQGGQPNKQQQADFLRWLNENEAHRRAYEQAKNLWLSPEVEAAARQLDMPDQPSSAHPFKSVKWLSLATAAAVVVTLSVSLQLVGQAQYQTSAGERQKIALSDGSIVTLNSRTDMDTHFSDNERRVELHEGEAYFQIARDVNRPFSIISGDSRVSVLGTSFNVRTLDDGIRVSVSEGLVAVAHQGLDEEQLQGGDWAQTSANDIDVARVGVGPEDFGWINGRLVVYNRSMSSVVNEVRRYVPGVIVLLGDEQPQQRVSGNFSLDDPIHALQTLAQLNDYQLIRLTDYLLIVRPTR